MNKVYLFVTLVSLAISPDLFSQEKPEETEVWEPVPEFISTENNIPSDALILFSKEKGLSEWEGENGGEAEWTVEGDHFTVAPGKGIILTKKQFGDVQLHIEWRSPIEVSGEGQGRGNSGIFLMGLYEVQVLDSYDNRTYSNGQAGSIYKQHIPLVNATRAPGEWQEYDIIFDAPVFDAQGNVESPAYVTVIHNGVVVQNHVEIKGPTVYIGKPAYEAHANKLPLTLQDHGNTVSFRNIWIREL